MTMLIIFEIILVILQIKNCWTYMIRTKYLKMCNAYCTHRINNLNICAMYDGEVRDIMDYDPSYPLMWLKLWSWHPLRSFSKHKYYKEIIEFSKRGKNE